MSLLGSIEKVNLITEMKLKQSKKLRNLFKKKFITYKDSKSLPKLEEVNKFTSDILTSKNWKDRKGTNNSIGMPFRNPWKPGRKELNLEVGLKGYISRSRIKKNKYSIKIPEALQTMDFFKQ